MSLLGFRVNGGQRNTSRQLAISQMAASYLDPFAGMQEHQFQSFQDVVKITLKSLFDVLNQQGESIKGIERTLDTKAGRAELSVALQQKANAGETAARLAEVRAGGGHATACMGAWAHGQGHCRHATARGPLPTAADMAVCSLLSASWR